MLRNDDEVLLQLRKNCSFAGNYGFVGGHLDGNEKIIDVAKKLQGILNLGVFYDSNHQLS